MNKDFHFGVVTILSRWAGFTKEEAGTVAYASQFVDELYFNGEITFDRGKNKAPFAYTYRQTVKETDMTLSLAENKIDVSNRDAWVPFHFISGDKDMVTRRNNSVARKMITNAIVDAKANPKFALHRLGAALHSFADTWSHDGFIGIEDNHNSIWLNIFDCPLWHIGDAAKSWALWEVIWLGHTTLFSYPDYTYHNLTYHKRLYKEDGLTKDKDIRVARREPNYTWFIDAAEEIYKFLQEYKGRDPEPFTEEQSHILESTMRKNTTNDYDEALNYWYAKMNKGKFGPELSNDNFIRYDGGKAWMKQIKYKEHDDAYGGDAWMEKRQYKSSDTLNNGPDDASEGFGLTAVPYWTNSAKWNDDFWDCDFYKFCEATKRQRFDTINLMRDAGIQIC